MKHEGDDPPLIRTIATRFPFPETVSAGSFPPQSREIHVWTVLYRDLDQDYESLSSFISPGEREKASQFRKTTDARDYTLRRGYCRLVLGRILGTDPARVPIVTGGNGKPGIGVHEGTPSFFFSISHTREMVALAVTARYDIGIDIVQPDERYPVSGTMEYLFSPEERREIRKIPADLQRKAFFRAWALKEALLKARGGTARMMKETDLSGINGIFSHDHVDPVSCRIAGRVFFLSGFPIPGGHFCAIAACDREGRPD